MGKNTLIVWMILSVVLTLPRCLAQNQPEVTLELIAKKDTYILGEPIYVKEVWENGPCECRYLRSLIGHSQKKRCGAPVPIEYVPSEPTSAKNSSQSIQSTDVKGKIAIPSPWTEISDIQTICQLNQIGTWELECQPDWDMNSPILASLRIHIIEPRGEDRRAYEETQGDPMSHPDIILNRYPTSTYAAWVLLRKLYGPDPYNMKRWVNPLHPETTPSWAPQFKDDEAHHFLFIIRNVLQNHPEFPFLNHLKYAEIGMLNQLNRRNELIKRLEVYRHDPDPITAQWAQFYYDVFTHGKDK